MKNFFYIIIIVGIIISYLNRDFIDEMNPMGLKEEENPKMHNGSLPFNTGWKSSITPSPPSDCEIFKNCDQEEIIYTPQTE